MRSSQVRVAIIREEGSNGDREMAAAIHAAGMEPWDIHMSDLLNGKASLDSFRCGAGACGCSLSAAGLAAPAAGAGFPLFPV
jgi:phosphoribosylformylglycinamidine (FGAM) synthase-like amidotransferase family enzyme